MVEKLYRLLYPLRVVLIGCGNKENANAMAAAWCFPLSMDPPLFGISIAKNRHSYELIEKNKAFTINIPGEEMKEQVWVFGTETGKKINKFEKTETTPEFGKVNAPMIKECNASIECEVIEIKETGDHFVFIGKAVNTVKRKEGEGLYQKGSELVPF